MGQSVQSGAEAAGPVSCAQAEHRTQAGAAADAADRGRTTVSRQAVERIAARLTAESSDVGGAARRVLGVHVGEPGDEAAVSARLHGARTVSLAVRCSVPYPRPAGRSSQALREMLMARVEELTGLRVQRVDITVTELRAGSRGRRVE